MGGWESEGLWGVGGETGDLRPNGRSIDVLNKGFNEEMVRDSSQKC